MRVTQRQIRFLTKSEIDRIIETCDVETKQGMRDRALLDTLFSTGLRISEALALEREKFLIAGNYEVDSKLTLEHSVIGKGGYQRVVYFSPQALRSIRHWVNKRKDEDERLFPLTARRVQLMIKERARKAHITKFVSPHVMRHSMATYLLGQGVDIRFVQEFLGHRSLNNTMIYAHVVNTQLKKIHAKLYK